MPYTNRLLRWLTPVWTNRNCSEKLSKPSCVRKQASALPRSAAQCLRFRMSRVAVKRRKHRSRNESAHRHFRVDRSLPNGNDALDDLIQRDLALTPPMVIVKIACGMLPAPRPPTLNNLGLLRPCHQASLYEVKAFIEREKLYGLGCGLVDMALLASALMTPGAKVWTQDLRLANLAGRFGVAHCPTLH